MNSSVCSINIFHARSDLQLLGMAHSLRRISILIYVMCALMYLYCYVGQSKWSKDNNRFSGDQRTDRYGPEGNTLLYYENVVVSTTQKIW